MEIFTELHTLPIPELNQQQLELLNKAACALLRGEKDTSLKAMKVFEKEVPNAHYFFMSGINNAKVLSPEAWNALAFDTNPPPEYLQDIVGGLDTYMPKLKEICENLEKCGSPVLAEAAAYASEGTLFIEIAGYIETQYYESKYALQKEFKLYEESLKQFPPEMSGSLFQQIQNTIVKGDVKRLKEVLLAFWNEEAIEFTGNLTFLDLLLFERHLIHFHTDQNSGNTYILPDLPIFSYLRSEGIRLPTTFSVCKPERGYVILNQKYQKYGVNALDEYSLSASDTKLNIGNTQLCQFFHYMEMLDYWYDERNHK